MAARRWRRSAAVDGDEWVVARGVPPAQRQATLQMPSARLTPPQKWLQLMPCLAPTRHA